MKAILRILLVVFILVEIGFLITLAISFLMGKGTVISFSNPTSCEAPTIGDKHQ